MSAARFPAAAILVFCVLGLARGADLGNDGPREALQNYIRDAEFIVDISIHEQEYFAPSNANGKGRLVTRGVVTVVRKGDIAVGTKLEYEHFIESAPRDRQSGKTVVKDAQRTFFFTREDGTLDQGKYTLKGDGHWGFDRNSTFYGLFQEELKRNPKLRSAKSSS